MHKPCRQHGDWQAETHHVVEPDGSQKDLILLVCGKCGHVTGIKRQTPPEFRGVDDTPRAPWRADPAAMPGPDDTQRVSTQPPKVGESEPPPEPLRRPRRDSNAGLYIRTRRR